MRKLKVYCLQLNNCCISYMRGTLPTSLGALYHHTEGFMLTGVLLTMQEQLAKAEINLGKAGRALGALRLAYVRVPQVVLVFIVFAVECVYEAMPPPTCSRRALSRGWCVGLAAASNTL